jgi:hypothetical protein
MIGVGANNPGPRNHIARLPTQSALTPIGWPLAPAVWGMPPSCCCLPSAIDPHSPCCFLLPESLAGFFRGPNLDRVTKFVRSGAVSGVPWAPWLQPSAQDSPQVLCWSRVRFGCPWWPFCCCLLAFDPSPGPGLERSETARSTATCPAQPWAQTLEAQGLLWHRLSPPFGGPMHT